MNVKDLVRYIQWKIHLDLQDVAREEAVTATAAAIGQARADAASNGRDPDVAAAAVEAVKPRRVDDEIPTMDWVERMIRKHAVDARQAVGRMQGLKADLLDRVRADPDDAGRRRSPPGDPPGGGPPG